MAVNSAFHTSNVAAIATEQIFIVDLSKRSNTDLWP